MSFPSSPTNGQTAVINNITYAYSSATNSWTRQQHTFNNTGSTPPTTNLLVGDIWYNTTDDTVYRYTYDGTSYYWVDIVTPTVTSNSALNIVSGVNTINVVTLVANTINANTLTVSNETVTSLTANTITANSISANSINTNTFTTTSTYNIVNYVANTITVSGNIIANSIDISNYTTNTFTANIVNTSAIYANSYYFSNGTSLITGSSGGGGGAVADGVIYENSQNVASNYTITAGKNAMSAGPITINTGITVTIPTGSRWVIV